MGREARVKKSREVGALVRETASEIIERKLNEKRLEAIGLVPAGSLIISMEAEENA